MPKTPTLTILGFLIFLLTACTSLTQAKTLEDHRLATDVPIAPELTATVQAEIEASTPPKNCPVTTSAGNASFTAPEPYSPDAPWDGYFWFGTKGLWTAIPTDGVWQGLPDNPGGYTQKIMWWSDLYVLKEEPEPVLVVSGRRSDANAPPLQFGGATNASAGDIGDAMLTGVDFPTLGCWEIIGHYKTSELKFVVWIAP